MTLYVIESGQRCAGKIKNLTKTASTIGHKQTDKTKEMRQKAKSTEPITNDNKEVEKF